MYVGTLVYIPRHLSKKSNNNNKRCQLYIVACFAEFASIGFHFGFPVLWSFLYYSCLHSALPLVFYSTSLFVLSYHTMSIPYLILLAIYIYLLLYACPHDTVFNAYLWFRFIDTRVLIFARHLALASPLTGEFWLLWILLSKSWSWSLWILPVADLRGAAIAWIISRPSRSPSFKAPMLGSKVLLLWLWASFCTIHTCTSLCILTVAPIGDVIFL